MLKPSLNPKIFNPYSEIKEEEEEVLRQPNTDHAPEAAAALSFLLKSDGFKETIPEPQLDDALNWPLELSITPELSPPRSTTPGLPDHDPLVLTPRSEYEVVTPRSNKNHSTKGLESKGLQDLIETYDGPDQASDAVVANVTPVSVSFDGVATSRWFDVIETTGDKNNDDINLNELD